jgi:mannose-6-phosphate isomerase-like protein (cupin superfamily)
LKLSEPGFSGLTDSSKLNLIGLGTMPRIQQSAFLYKTSQMNKVNLIDKFNKFNEYWSPKIAGALNGQQVKLVKFKGPFTWHHHEHEDELFYVVKGNFTMEFRDKNVHANEGEFIIVPKAVDHRPNAAEEVWVMLFEPATTLNTGNLKNEFTKDKLDII